MDLIQIGKFIAALRKEAGLTQEQLAEKLGITNKTVSRWETGTYLPSADMLLAMSELFSVTINELLSGRRLTSEEYQQAAEENLTEVVHASSFTLQERIEFFKRKWLKEHLFTMVLIGIVLIAVFIAGIVMKKLYVLSVLWFLFLLAHLWRHNTMMTYVEERAFDGTGPDAKQ